MCRTKLTRNVFIDSAINHEGSGGRVKIVFPPDAFRASETEAMRLSLTSLSMRRSWYSINETNNTFYLYDPATTSIINEFTIAPGTYSSFVDLASAIQAALQASYPPATCAYDAITRKFALLSPL